MKFFVAAFLILASHLSADVNQAKAFYLEGMKLQMQKQYQPAIEQYEKSLQAEPRYAYAYKQIGTCKYYLGDQPGALAAYQKYETVVPSDAPVQAFITRMEATGVQPAATAPAAGAPLAGTVALGDSPFSVSLGLAYNTYAMSDLNSDASKVMAEVASVGGTSTDPSVHGGPEIDLNVGYNFNSNMKLGLDLQYLMANSHEAADTSFGSAVEDLSFPLLWIGPEFDMTFYRFGAFKLRGQAGFGYTMLVGAGGTESSNSAVDPGGDTSGTISYTGNGLGFELGPGVDWPINSTFSLSFDLQYRFASISSVNFTQTSTSGGMTTTTSGTVKETSNSQTTESLDYTGLHARLGLNVEF